MVAAAVVAVAGAVLWAGALVADVVLMVPADLDSDMPAVKERRSRIEGCIVLGAILMFGGVIVAAGIGLVGVTT